MAKRFAPVTSIEPTTSIEDDCRHELQQVLQGQDQGAGCCILAACMAAYSI